MKLSKDILGYLYQFVIYFVIIGQTVFYFEDVHILHLLFSAARFACFFVVSVQYLRRWSSTPFGWMMLSYFAVALLLTMIGNGNIITPVSYGINIFTLYMLVRLYLEPDPQQPLRILSQVFSLIVYLNLITLIINPNGIMPDRNFLIGGNYNQMGLPLVCAVVTNGLYYRVSGKMLLNTVFLMLATVISPLIVGSMTSTVTILIFIVFMCIPYRALQRLGVWMFAVFYLIFQTFAVYVQTDLSKLTYLVFFIEDVLHKDMTFTTRTFVWEHVRNLIAESPWIGYGMQDKIWYIEKMNVTTCHNLFYQILVEGGVVLLAVFLAIFIVSFLKSARLKTTAASTLLFGVVTALFMMTMESYPIFLTFYLMFLMYFLPEISGSPELSKVKP